MYKTLFGDGRNFPNERREVNTIHRSSLAISIETARGVVIITDTFFKYGNIESSRYLGVIENMMEADATWSRIRKEADLFASIYDPEVFTRQPGGILA